jgi:S-adenosylmethionine synthetase
MSKNLSYFASESVCAGHPDKICDAISDAVLDAVLTQDPNGRVAVEALVADNHIILAGEVTTTANVDFELVARNKIKELGYIDSDWGFSYESKLDNFIHQQSPEIAIGVDLDGAGDQGMMFGFACEDTKELLPLPISIAHSLTKKIDSVRETKTLSYLRPDGKAQVVVGYEADKPKLISHVTVAVPHDEKISTETVFEDVYRTIVSPVLLEYGFEIQRDQLVVNGTGIWNIPGPSSDCGLTGRKIVVDGYGGYARVGGGAFSGKDPSKVDRSGAYAARFIAKNIVASKLASKVEVSVAYYIGAKKPVMLNIDAFGTEKVSLATIYEFTDKLIDPSVAGIIKYLDLKRPIYSQTSAYGHFGKANLPWEKIIQIK